MDVTEKEHKHFTETYSYMSIVQLSSSRSYSNLSLNHLLISYCYRWKEIKRSLHFTNNDDAVAAGNRSLDKLFKILPIISKLRKRLLKDPKKEYLAIDEHIIPTHARYSIKQYNPNKPSQMASVLSADSRFSWDYQFSTGNRTNIQWFS